MRGTAALLGLLAGCAGATAPTGSALVAPWDLPDACAREADQAALEDVLRQAQVEPAPFAPWCSRWLGSAAPARSPLRLPDVEAMFRAQAFEAMHERLTAFEDSSMDALSRAENRRIAGALNRQLGVALAALGRQNAAKARFALAHRLAPEDPLNPGLYPPKMVAAFFEAREQESRAPVAKISAPQTHDLLVDGQPVSALASVPLGLHYLRLERLGFAPSSVKLEVTADVSLPPLQTPAPPDVLRAQVVAAWAAARDEVPPLDPVLPEGLGHVLWWRRLDGGLDLRRRDLRTGTEAVLYGVEPRPSLWAELDGGGREQGAPWWLWALIGSALVAAGAAGIAVAAEAEPTLEFRVR